MRIIDKKGKLFGLINIIDLTVLLVLAVLIIAGGSRLLKTTPQISAETKKGVIEFEISKVRQQTIDGIQEGDILYHYDRGQVFGKVIKKEVTSYMQPVETNNGELKMAEVPGKFDIILQIESDVIDTPGVVIVGGEHTRVGTGFRIKSKNVAVFGYVLGVEVVQ